jgi:hypothetical protein
LGNACRIFFGPLQLLSSGVYISTMTSTDGRPHNGEKWATPILLRLALVANLYRLANSHGSFLLRSHMESACRFASDRRSYPKAIKAGCICSQKARGHTSKSASARRRIGCRQITCRNTRKKNSPNESHPPSINDICGAPIFGESVWKEPHSDFFFRDLIKNSSLVRPTEVPLVRSEGRVEDKRASMRSQISSPALLRHLYRSRHYNR